MHYYSTETLDTQSFQPGTVTQIQSPLTALQNFITRTVMTKYCISVVAVSVYKLKIHYTKNVYTLI